MGQLRVGEICKLVYWTLTTGLSAVVREHLEVWFDMICPLALIDDLCVHVATQRLY